ncbi:MAG: hypothetical protein JNK65_09230, partial [Deltaproteobacteria bacterium]|nr:hypothetical protein [Deltaproteobacteria bacterium]
AESFDADKFAQKISSVMDLISDLIKKLGGLDGILSIVKEGLIAFAALKVASFFTGLATDIGMVSGGFTGLSGSIASATGSLQAFVVAYTGIQAFDKTFNFIRGFEKEQPQSKKYFQALGNAIVPGLGLFEAGKNFNKFILSDRIGKVDEIRGYGPTRDRHFGEGQFTPAVKADIPQQQNFSPAINSDGSGLQSRLSSLTQEIASQQSTLKKPQKIEMNINISSPVPTQVTGIKGGENTSITASTGKMVN